MDQAPRSAARSFWLKLAIVAAPPALYLTVCVGVPLYNGEVTPLLSVARAQRDGEIGLYGRAYRDDYFAFKLVAAKEGDPSIIALGSSRIMQMRGYFWASDSLCFYNAGGAAQSIADSRAYLENLWRSNRPEIVVLSIDHPWINGSITEHPETRHPGLQVDSEEMGLYRAMNVGRLFFADLVQAQVSLPRAIRRRDPLTNVPARGIAASVNGNGFRRDGSYQYGTRLIFPRSTAERLAEGWSRYRIGDRHFAPGDAINNASLAQLDALLGQARGRGVFVIGVTPPFAPSIYQAMLNDGNHQYLRLVEPTLRALFEQHGFWYRDFSDAAKVGASDDEMLDAFHANEDVFRRIHAELPRVPVRDNCGHQHRRTTQRPAIQATDSQLDISSGLFEIINVV